MTERLFLDVSRYWNNSDALLPDLGALVSEQAKGAEWHERVVPYELRFDSEGLPVGFKLDFSDETARLESQAVMDVYNLGLRGIDKMVWVSPPTDIYSEMRIVLMEKKKEEELVFDCVAICAPHNQIDCLFMAKGIGINVEEVDELRGRVIEVKDWQIVLDLLGMSKVSEVVLRRDFSAYEERVRVLGSIYDDLVGMVRRVTPGDYWQAVRTGSQIEQVLARNGLALTSSGSCGISNSEMMANHKGNGLFDRLYLASPLVTVSSGEAYFECPKCKGKIPSGKGITTCPHCGMRKEDCSVVCG